MKEIAEMAGVSRGTVDRVLNNRGIVNPQTAEKIRKIAAAVNYTPNLAGKTLAVRKKQLKFGFVLFNTFSNPFFLDVERGIADRREAFREYGVQVEVRHTDIDDPYLQVTKINKLVAEGIHGLVITPINHPVVIEKLKELTAAGIPVVTTNSDIPGCGRLAYVGSEYYQSGRTAAGLMNLVCQGEATVGIVIGAPNVLCHSERVAGFTNQLQTCYPKIQIADMVVNQDDDLESYAVTSEMLRTHPDINALFLAAAGVKGACRAVADMGRTKQIKVISYDTTPDIRKLIESGAIVATIAQQPFIQGSKPLDILLDYLGMDIPPEQEYYYTKTEIKIRENIEEELNP